MVYTWFVIVIILGLLEAFTTNLVSIWFVISGILAMFLSLVTDNIYIQIGLFVVGGILLMPVSKVLYKKIKVNNTRTNFDRIIGMKGLVTEDITKDNIGEVKVDGKRWSAYADNNIKKGTFVQILSINSVKIKVKKWED